MNFLTLQSLANIKRFVLIFAGALLLTYLLVSAGQWFITNTTGYGKLLKDHDDGSTGLYFYEQEHSAETKPKYGGDWLDLFIQTGWEIKLAVSPVIIVFLGIYAGLVSHWRLTLITIACLTPFLCYSLQQPNFYWLDLNLIAAVVYLGLGVIVAWLTRIVVTRYSNSTPTTTIGHAAGA